MDYFTPDDKPFGLTYGNWTTKWWQWLLSKPKKENPAIDETGKNASVGQEYEKIWFLAGTFVNMDVPTRKVTIPMGKAILFPTICYQANFLEDPIFKNEVELAKHVKNDIDDIIIHESFVDGIQVPAFRVGSDPTLFSVILASDIPHGVDGVDTGATIPTRAGSTTAVSDGYWTFLKPLSHGSHQIHFKGSCSGGKRKTEAFYAIEII